LGNVAGVATRLPAARRRRQLLDVAQEAFAGAGFHGTSMDDIADAAGVTKPVLYQHFPSKRDLYLELLEDVGRQLLEAITTATSEATTPRRQVEAGFTAYFSFVADNVSAFRLLFGSGARRDEEFDAAVTRVTDAIGDAIAGLIEADIDADHRRLLAAGIVGLAESACRHWVRHDLDLTPDLLARRIADLAYAGLRGVHR
jgi:AcrR family transcriptional regulator